MEINRQIIHSLIFAAFLVMITGSFAGASAVPEINLEPVGHFGGIIEAVEVTGNYAYVGQGQELLILDITNPSSPVSVGKIMTRGLVGDIKVSGNYAYVGDSYNGFLIVDISNPSFPFIKGRYAGFAYRVLVSGNYAFVTGLNCLMIIDISNPSSPTLKGRYAGYIVGFSVSGNYAYIADYDNGLVIVDISNPSSLILKGSNNTDGDTSDVSVSGNYAYVADAYNGLAIFDISNPSSPFLKGSYNTTGYAQYAVSGNYAFVTDDNGLTIVDISNPSSPIFKGHYACPAWDVAVSGNYIYVCEGVNGFAILKANPEQLPLLVANFSSNVTSGNEPLSVQFNDSSVNASVWNWDFGDGLNSTNQNPVHIYSSVGAYTVNLIVSNANRTASKETTIYVLKTTSSNEESSDNSGGKAGGVVNSTKGTNTPTKENERTPGFEIASGVANMLAAFCMKDRKGN